MTNIKTSRSWLAFALITTVFWGIWGALIEIPEKAGFPATLGYIVWSFTMIPCAIVALKIIHWKLDTSLYATLLGSSVGILGAGGQLILFLALKEGPAYIVFPLVSLFPVLTIIMSMTFLREKATGKQYIGIAFALLAIFLLSSSGQKSGNTTGILWQVLAILVFIMWGIQAFTMKFSNESMKAESIFFYMMITSLLLSPVAYLMTDFSQPINWGLEGPYLAFIIHLLNSIGALMLVYALRYGKAIVVVPLTGLSPVITIVLSLLIYSVYPDMSLTIGILVALVAIYLISD